MPLPRSPHRFPALSSRESRVIGDILRTETVGGALLILGATVALLWANSPWSAGYLSMREYVPLTGWHRLHLDLTLGQWAGDGLLAIFFFVVGLELKPEFLAGDLRDPGRAVLPVVAAVGGMLVPAAIYLAINAGAAGGAPRGWAIPIATDIAFALAVLALIGSHLPGGLRAFLLTLAVVDDLLAIAVIAVFYTDEVRLMPLLGSLLAVVVFGALVQRERTWWWALGPLALLSWSLLHASGVHATIAGVALGFTVPVAGRLDRKGLAPHFEHIWRPVSAGLAVPVFAFFTAGVPLADGALVAVFRDRVGLGVLVGLVLGKAVGVFGSTYLVARFTRASLAEGLAWTDVLGVALLAGIGFTVSLLVGDLAFGVGSETGDIATAAVLVGSVLSAALASVVLSGRDRTYRDGAP